MADEIGRFFDLVKGGATVSEAQKAACMSEEQIEFVVGLCSEVLDAEKFSTSNYDFAIARRVERLERSLAKRDVSLMHDLKNLSKAFLELTKAVNRLTDVHTGPRVSEGLEGKVLQFPTTTPPQAS